MTAISMTVLKVKPGNMDAARELGHSVSDRVLKIPGIISWGWAETGENEFTTIAAFNDRAAAESAASAIEGIQAEMASMIAAPPQRQIMDGEWFTQ